MHPRAHVDYYSKHSRLCQRGENGDPTREPQLPNRAVDEGPFRFPFLPPESLQGVFLGRLQQNLVVVVVDAQIER